MIAKIDKRGKLHILRRDEMKVVMCPYTGLPCGDNCALFGEPEVDLNVVVLKLCHNTYRVDARYFEDERGNDTKK